MKSINNSITYPVLTNKIKYIKTKVELVEGTIYNEKILNKDTETHMILFFDRIDDNGNDILENTTDLFVCIRKHLGENLKLRYNNIFIEDNFGDAPYQFDVIMSKISK